VLSFAFWGLEALTMASFSPNLIIVGQKMMLAFMLGLKKIQVGASHKMFQQSFLRKQLKKYTNLKLPAWWLM